VRFFDEFEIALPRFTRPAVDAVLRQPVQVDIRSCEQEQAEKAIGPGPSERRGEGEKEGEDENDFEQTEPLRLMLLEVTEADVATAKMPRITATSNQEYRCSTCAQKYGGYPAANKPVSAPAASSRPVRVPSTGRRRRVPRPATRVVRQCSQHGAPSCGRCTGRRRRADTYRPSASLPRSARRSG
jgi:hypothetical protein